MFKQSGESYGAEPEQPRCPGEDQCSPFNIAKSETGDGEDACRGCELLPTKGKTADVSEDASIAEDVEKMIAEIEDMVFWETAGSATDWELYPFETRQLYGIWREAEKQVSRIQQGRMQMFIKSFGSEK